jgi:hypothetical protein
MEKEAARARSPAAAAPAPGLAARFRPAAILYRLRSSALAPDAAVLLAYFVFAIGMTYPLVTRLTQALPGDGVDAWHHYHNLWWIRRALVDLHTNPFFTLDIFYPYGAHLYYHSLLLAPGVIALPVILLFGLTAGYNFVALFSFVAGGYGAYRLALYLLVGLYPEAARPARLAAFVAGTAYSFSAFHFMRLLGHLELASLEWLPFYALYLCQTWRERRWRYPLLAAVFLSLAMLTALYFGMFLLLFTALFALYHCLADGLRRSLPALARTSAGVTAFGLVLSPIFIPMIRLGPSLGRVADPLFDITRFSADLASFVTPSPLHPLWGSRLWAWYLRLAPEGNAVEAVTFLGFAPLVLAAWAARPIWARQRFWLTAFSFFTLMALGPSLHVLGQAVTLFGRPVPLPYALFYRLPLADIGRAPSRFAVMSSLCLAVLAGHGCLLLLQRRSPVGSRVLFGLLVGWLLFENAALPYPTTPVEASPFYARLARDPRPVAVLEVPIPDHPGVYPRRMFYQTLHGKPVYGGYLSRGLPPLPFSGVPGFGQFKTLSPEMSDVIRYPEGDLPAISLQALALFDAGYVVIDKTLLDPAQLDRAREIARQLFGEAAAVYEDATTLAYAVPPPVEPAPTFIYVGQGWHGLEVKPAGASPETPLRWRWMPERADLGLQVSDAGPWRLRLRGWAFERPRRLAVWLDGEMIAEWEIQPQAGEYESRAFTAPPGSHTLNLVSLDGAGTPGDLDPRRLSVAVTEISLEPQPRLDGR